ncbi:hypothetical protein BD410DRAFT_700995, partial [Rickenella mellea]
MALIRALPAEYSSFASSLLLLEKFDKAKLHQAFITEENNRVPRPTVDSPIALRSAAIAHSSTTKCTFCTRTGHVMENCYKFRDAKQLAATEASEPIQQRQNTNKKNRRGRGGKANQASNDASSSTTTTTTELAGNASTHDWSHPASLLVSDASSDWNTDTGATSHMTPHRHWFTTYTPFRVPIRLANNDVIYSAGVGTVRFQPVM